MRTLVAISVIVMSGPAWAGENQPSHRVPADGRGLTKDEVEHYAAPYFPEIRACYSTYGRPARNATGELSLRLVVNRGGDIHELTIDAPGVSGAYFRELTRCIRKTAETWHFPVRRDFTTAIVPYYFMYLHLPGTGPQLSCWNPKGCPEKVSPAPPHRGRASSTRRL
jgi:hypothetical protein